MFALRLLRRPAFLGCLTALTLVAAPAAPPLHAQSGAGDAPATAKPAPPPEKVENFHLKNIHSQNDLTDLQTDLRNAYPKLHVFAVASRDIITVRGTAEELEQVRQLLADLDQPHRVYRLTYTLTTLDNGKPQAPEHFSLLLTANSSRATLRRGLRVPVSTGSWGAQDTPPTPVIQYQDVGLNLDTTLESNQIRSKVEVSSLSEEKSGIGSQDPILQQSLLEDSSLPGGQRSLKVELLAELLP
jgi:hypothetical protein